MIAPCGTPAEMLPKLEKLSFILALNLRFSKKFLIHTRIYGGRFKFINLKRRPGHHTLSNAFEISKKRQHTFFSC